MALINCLECNHKVSDRAAACPSCAFPLSIHKEFEKLKGLFDTGIITLDEFSEMKNQLLGL